MDVLKNHINRLNKHKFIEEVVKFKLTDKQKEFINSYKYNTLMRFARQEGSSTACYVRAIAQAKFGLNKTILFAVPGHRQVQVAMDAMIRILEQSDFEDYQIIKTLNQIKINNNTITIQNAGSSEKVIGRQYDECIVDGVGYIDREDFKNLTNTLVKRNGLLMGICNN